MKAVLERRSEPATSLDISLPGRAKGLRLRQKPSHARVVAPCVVLAAVLGAWSFASHVLLDPDRRFLLPPPESVIARGLLGGADLSEMLGALLSTAEVAVVGFVLAIVLGVSVGILMSQARWLEYSIYNNLHNPFAPFGNANLLQAAWLAGIVQRMADEEGQRFLLDAITRGPASLLGLPLHGPNEGALAHLVVLDTDDPEDAISQAPTVLATVRGGRLTYRLSGIGAPSARLG